MLHASRHRAGSISELLEPAMEGPPSPETIRAMNMQMRLASNSVSSHQTTSSGSSSLRSLGSMGSSSAADRRPSWDMSAMDASTTSASTSASSLSRRSSGRSTASMQPRDSVQIFGKNIFGRRTRGRRESSAQSSASSVYSATTDAPAPAPVISRTAMDMISSPPLPSSSSSSSRKSFHITSSNFFTRRRANTRSDTIDEETAEGAKKLMISGPFNFQHLTSPQKGSRTSFVVSPAASEDDSNRTSFFPDFTAVGPSSTGASSAASAVPTSVPRRPPMRPHAASVSGAIPALRTLVHTRSQDQLRFGPMPPRPPRSPIEASHMSFSPPAPPPRLSSRASLGANDIGTAPRTFSRPQTSGGCFRQSSSSSSSSAPSFAHAHSYSADLGLVPLDMRRFSQMLPLVPMPAVAAPVPVAVATAAAASPHDDSNWPLPPSPPPPATAVSSPSMMAAAVASSTTCGTLPGVPEEDELNLRSSNSNNNNSSSNSKHQSRLSIASSTTSSSLRKSHSEPLLQQFPQPPMSPRNVDVVRPPSAMSDTLGSDDAFRDRDRDLVQDAYVYGDDDDNNDASDLLSLGANWEDDIDYCYEHEIEADCEYAWERSSMDLSRDELDAADLAAGFATSASSEGTTPNNTNNSYFGNYHTSPQLLLNHGSFDMPELSPASHASTVSLSEVATPTLTATGFSTRRNHHPGLTIQTAKTASSSSQHDSDRFLHARSNSRVSMLSESFGFDLSPSLFIPGSDKYDYRPAHNRHDDHHVDVVGSSGGFAFGAEDDDVSEHAVDDMMMMMPPYLDGQVILGMSKSMLYMPTRASASTMGSGESRDSMHSSSHVSTATDLTQLTSPSMEDLRFNKNPNRESLIIPF